MALHESLRGSSGHRRPPLTGIAFLQDEAVQPRRFSIAGSKFQARDLLNLLLRTFSPRRAAPQPEPRCHIRLNVLTPSGRHAVRIVTRKRVTAVAEQAPARARRG
jgi:hypothetical protein